MNASREGEDPVWEAPEVEVFENSAEQAETGEPGVLNRIINRVSRIDPAEVTSLASKQVAEMARLADLVMTLGTSSRVVIQTASTAAEDKPGFVLIKMENVVIMSATQAGTPVAPPFMTTVDMVVNSSELKDLRLNIELVARSGSLGAYTTLPRWEGQTEEVFRCIDKIHNELGHNSADIYESYEALNLGVMSSKFETSSWKDEFLEAKLADIAGLKPHEVGPSMVTLPDRFGGTVQKTPEEVVKCVIELSSELAQVLKDSGSRFQHHVEFFNLNRAMLYAVPDLLSGYKKAMKVMMREPHYEQSTSDPDSNCDRIWREEDGYVNLRVALWHLEKYGCMPELAPGSEPQHPVIAQYYKDKVVSINLVREGPRNLLNWSGYDHAPIDDFEVLLDPGELEIDKSCALPLNEAMLRYPSDCTGTFLKPLCEKRVLMHTLREELDLYKLAELHESGEFYQEMPMEFHVTLPDKERDAKKNSRKYGMATPKRRVIPSMADRNFKSKIKPIFPEITLGLPYLELIKKLISFSKRPGKVARFSIYDFRKWCQHKRVRNQENKMKKYDSLLRFNGRVGKYYQQLHHAYNKTVYTSGAVSWTPASLRLSKEEREAVRKMSEAKRREFCAKWAENIAKVCAAERDRVVNMSESEFQDFMNSVSEPEPFMGSESAVEGQNQSTWGGPTCVEVSADTFDIKDVDTEHVCAGDNLVGVESIAPPAHCPVGSENEPEWSAYFDNVGKSCFERVLKRRTACGEPMNQDECLQLSNFFVFNKIFVSAKGVIYPSVFKHGVKLTEKIDDFWCDLGKKVGTISASSLENANRSGSEAVGFIVVGGRIALEHLKELCVPTSGPMEPNPVTWNVITEREKIMTRRDGKASGSMPDSNFITDIVNYTLTLPSNFQHLPVFGPSAYSVRQFPSPSVRDLTDLYHQALNPENCSPYARAAYTGLQNSTSVCPKPLSSVETWLEDPTNMPLVKMEDPNVAIRDAITEALNEFPIKNRGYKKIFKKRFKEDEKKKIVAVYSSCLKIQPRVLSSHYMRTVPGFVEMRMQKFQAKSTAVKLCDINEANRIGHTKSQATVRKRLELYGRITGAFRVSGTAKTQVLKCPSALAQDVYKALWPKENPVVNSVTPDPVHAWSFTQVPGTAEVPESCVGFLLTMSIAAAKAAQPEALFDEISGPFSTFVGSETASGAVHETAKAKKSDPAAHAQEEEAMNLDWYSEPSDGNDATAIGSFLEFGKRVILSRGEMPFEFFLATGKKRTRGTVAHRIADPRTPAESSLCGVPTFTAVVEICAEFVGVISRDSRQWMTHFQAVIAHALQLFSRAYTGEKLKDIPSLTRILVRPRCGSCMIPAEVSTVDTSIKKQKLPTLKTDTESKYLYAKRGAHAAEQRGSLETAFPLLVEDENFSDDGSREFVIASVIHASGSSKTTVDVYKNPFRPVRGPPVVGFRDMAMCSLSSASLSCPAHVSGKPRVDVPECSQNHRSE